MKSEGTNPLWVNTLDAQELGIKEGDKVRLKSPWGEVETRAHVTWDIMRGVLGAAGGFGHIRGLEGDPKYPQFGGGGGQRCRHHETQLHRKDRWHPTPKIHKDSSGKALN